MRPVSPYQEPSPQFSGSGLNAPGGCLSNPTTSAISAEPAASIACAVASAEPPVAQPLRTLMNGTPVRPRTETVVSALPAASEPPAANSTSCQPTPASARAARAATAAISSPDTPSWRPNGWIPTPTTATSDIRPERVGQRAAGARRRDQDELHRHPDPQALGVGFGQPRLDPHLARKLDIADAVGLEVLGGAGVGRRLGREALDRPGPEGPVAGQPAFLHVARRARRARALAREGHDPAAAALGPDQLGRVRRPCEETIGDEVNRHRPARAR